VIVIIFVGAGCSRRTTKSSGGSSERIVLVLVRDLENLDSVVGSLFFTKNQVQTEEPGGRSIGTIQDIMHAT